MINRFLNRVSPFRSVRARFSAAMAASGMAMGLALTLFMQWHLEEALRASARGALEALVDEIAHQLSENMTTRLREVGLMADLIGGRLTVDVNAARKSMDELQSRESTYAWIGLADAQGRVVAASGGLLEGADVSARPWFAGGMRGGYVGDPHDAVLLARHLAPRADGEPLRFLDVAAPLRDDAGVVSGVLAGHLHWHWVHEVVSDTIARRRANTALEVLIADARGAWLLTFAPRENMSGTSLQVAQADRRHLVATQQVVARAAEGLGWTVLVRQDISSAYAPVDHVRRMMLAFTLFVAALFALASWMIAGRVVQPIVKLADVAKSHAPQDARDAGVHQRKAVDETMVLGAAMEQLAHHDRLTGLFNRSELLVRLQRTIDRATARHTCGALLLINLDNFSILNNTNGYEVGDQVLIAAAGRLQRLPLPGVVLARAGGDEFLVLLENLGGLEEGPDLVCRHADDAASAILAQFRQPLAMAQGRFTVSASIGIALVRDDGATTGEVLQRVELAMLEAKKRGKNTAVKFDQSLRDALHARLQFESALMAAIPDQLMAVYQPQVDLASGWQGAELLVRWRHATMGMVSPARFIPAAEETGLILPLGRWVLQTACSQLRAWESDPALSHLVLAVNVSAMEFRDPGFVQGVSDALAATGANPRRLKLELTESVVADDVDAVVEKMHILKSIGVSFSLDDFGTGFSSLGYLQRMPLDQLKIDQSFIRNIVSQSNDASIVRAVIALGQGLGLQVIAEGVETVAQRDLLTAYGCTSFQGYLYGRPVSASELEVHLASRKQ